MTKKILLSVFLLPAAMAFAQQYGGMWIPTEINEKEMKSLGMKIKAQDIWNTEKPSIKDAVVQFDGGCTAEIISPKGLLLTNHHCGYDNIQSHSTVENDLLTNGFWAKNMGEELPNPGVTVDFVTDIKEITQGDYTSYTMYVKTPDTTNSIYNITIEEVNDNTSVFLTKYEPSNNWTITSTRNFEGNIITYRISGITNDPVVLTSLLTEAFEGLQEGGNNGAGAGSGGSSTSNSYPYDCDGYVHSTTIITETKCGCGHDWQDFLSGDCTGCDGALPAFPNLSTNKVYECIPTNYNPTDGDTPNPGDTPGGGTNTGNNNTGDTSLTTIVNPMGEECNAPRGDLNNDCMLDENEANFVTFLDNLTTQERQLIISNNTTKMNTFNYLVEQNWSNESEQFVEELIDLANDYLNSFGNTNDAIFSCSPPQAYLFMPIKGSAKP